MNPVTSQNAAVTTGRLIEPIYFHRLGDCLRWDAVIRRQKIGSEIVGTIVQQSSRADERPITLIYKSSNRILFKVAVA
jgi:hypothetical protein